MGFGGQSLVAPLKRALVHTPGAEYNAKAWSDYGYPGTPDVGKAQAQHQAFLKLLTRSGVSLEPLNATANIQSLATTDPALMTNRGAIILNSGKPARRPEAWPMARRLIELEIPIVGWLTGDEYADGGDLLWLNDSELVIGRSHRTNRAGALALATVLERLGVRVHHVAMAWADGPADVLHLMSAISMVRSDLAIVYRPHVPLSVFDLLEDCGIRCLDIGEGEFLTQGCNVLSVDGHRVILCAGNPIAQAALEAEGLKVLTFDGSEFCQRRGAGPTCHILPLLRQSA